MSLTSSPSLPSKRNCAIIFVHIPKAAGTTLNKILARQYGLNRVFALKAGMKGRSLQDFEQMPAVQRQKLKVVRGHFNFGLHPLLPQPSTYITLLRDPVDRALSHYYYVLKFPTHYLHAQIAGQQMSLKDYVSSDLSVELDNHQTRMVAGGEAASAPVGHCSAQVLDVAKQHLQEQFAVVGTVERFDETLILLKEVFGWATPFYAKANVTQNRPKRRSLSTEELELITSRNQIDLELYDYANHRLDQLIQQHVKFFQLKLFKFRVLNRLYNYLYVLEKTLPQPLGDRLKLVRKRLDSPHKHRKQVRQKANQ